MTLPVDVPCGTVPLRFSSKHVAYWYQGLLAETRLGLVSRRFLPSDLFLFFTRCSQYHSNFDIIGADNLQLESSIFHVSKVARVCFIVR